MSINKIPAEYFLHDDVVALARSIIGCYLCTYIDGNYTAGRIVETEAYCGANDRACHAYNNRRTPRTEVMFGAPGVAYIYLCYGIHHLFNIVTNKIGVADAILVRAVEPVEGLAVMAKRRNKHETDLKLTSGPGALTQAMGITTALNQTPLTGNAIWLEYGSPSSAIDIRSAKRIGVDYAGDDANLPWRFYDAQSLYVSRKC